MTCMMQEQVTEPSNWTKWKISWKSIGILLGTYFLTALAFTLFRAYSNPFFVRLDAQTLAINRRRFAAILGGRTDIPTRLGVVRVQARPSTRRPTSARRNAWRVHQGIYVQARLDAAPVRDPHEAPAAISDWGYAGRADCRNSSAPRISLIWPAEMNCW